MYITGALDQNDRIVRISYHNKSHYNSIIGKTHTSPKDWILSDTLGKLEDIALMNSRIKNGLEIGENCGEFLKNEESSSVGGISMSIDQIRKVVEESRKGFARDWQRDLELVLEESRISYENHQKVGSWAEEAKAIEESNKTQEDELINIAIQESLNTWGQVNNTAVSSDEDAIQAAMLANAMENMNTGAYNRNELAGNPIVQQAVALGKNSAIILYRV